MAVFTHIKNGLEPSHLWPPMLQVFSRKLLVIGFAIVFLAWLFWPMAKPFPDDYSQLVLSSEGNLLRVTLASDQQYRFPPASQPLPEKYRQAVLVWEDKRFYQHPGVDPIALCRALASNVKNGRSVSGGSTITMQVARLAWPKSRTYFNKLREIFTVLKLTLHFSKAEILQMYADHVPMGGNFVGVNTAAWYYLGKPAHQLTWAEAALFAVLPNSPALMNLEKDRQRLYAKRNRLLKRLRENGVIDEMTLTLAEREPLPRNAGQFPFIAPHFTQYVLNQAPHTAEIRTTLSSKLQGTIDQLAGNYYPLLASKGISNLAVLVVETGTGKVRGYLGSADWFDATADGQVDGVQSARSTGSLLKPVLAAMALDHGPYTMASLLQDVPTTFGTFSPKNADKSFRGMASVEQMLLHSLNIPAVRLLKKIGVAPVYDLLHDAGLKNLFRGPDGYGLSLILGGAEAKLSELVQLYLMLGNRGQQQQQQPLIYLEDDTLVADAQTSRQLLSVGASWLTLEALQKVTRPDVDFYWRNFSRQIPVAWKTGTSFGSKDGWAIGMNGQWTVGVWVGNFSGEGNVEIGGAKAAAPLLFDIINQITDSQKPLWFKEPDRVLKSVEICISSGYPAGPLCPEKSMIAVPISAVQSGVCSFHRQFLVDEATGKVVCSQCWDGLHTKMVTGFILPPAAQRIYQRTGRWVEYVPQHLASCPASGENPERLEIVYPVNNISILVPRDFDGSFEQVVFQANSQVKDTRLFWLLDDNLIGETRQHHEVAVELPEGEHTLVVMDDEGYTRRVHFKAFRGEPG